MARIVAREGGIMMTSRHDRRARFTASLYPRRRASAGLAAAALGAALEGCAVFPLAAVGGAVLSASGSAISKGTEYTSAGTARRTFMSPIDDVHRAVLETLERAGLRLERDEVTDESRRLVGEAEHRTVKIELTPLTPTLTTMRLVVKRNILLKDKATAAELVEQTEGALADDALVETGNDASGRRAPRRGADYPARAAIFTR